MTAGQVAADYVGRCLFFGVAFLADFAFTGAAPGFRGVRNAAGLVVEELTEIRIGAAPVPGEFVIPTRYKRLSGNAD